MRIFSLAFLGAVTVAAAGITAGVTPHGGSGATVDKGNQRLLGIHHWRLKNGVTPEDFERFVASEWRPVISERYPGVHVMVMKGERNAQEGEYLLVWDVQTVDVRDHYFPTPDSASVAMTSLTEACGETCSKIQEQFNNMAEETSYADYVEIAND